MSTSTLSPWERLKNVTLAVEEIPLKDVPKNSTLRYRVRLTYANGESIVVRHTLRTLSWQAEDEMAKLQKCHQCRYNQLLGGPSHDGSRFCQSGSLASGGSRSHCSCDTCF
jgi:hypothetical protein